MECTCATFSPSGGAVHPVLWMLGAGLTDSSSLKLEQARWQQQVGDV